MPSLRSLVPDTPVTGTTKKMRKGVSEMRSYDTEATGKQCRGIIERRGKQMVT